jgi:hypothetical protein
MYVRSQVTTAKEQNAKIKNQTNRGGGGFAHSNIADLIYKSVFYI